MKKHTKIVAIALSVVMMLAMLISASGLEIFIIASSDEYKDYTTTAKYLETISVLKGYDDGQLHLEEPIQRYQAALFFARIATGITNESAYGTGKSDVFSDVPEYGPVMDLIANMGIIRGYGDGRFGYNAQIMYQDMCAMLVRVLGYETEEMIATYPISYITKVDKLGLALKNVKGTDYLNRGQTAQMVYDALVTEISQTSDAREQILADLLKKVNGVDDSDMTKDTYLERNFKVSSRMEFVLVATEKYKLDGYSFAAKDKITMTYTYTDDKNVKHTDEWTFPVEGGPTAGVSEADLIGKHFTLVFDSKTPTQAELDKGDIGVIYAEMTDPDVYENLGELNVVKYDKTKETLSLNKTTVKFADSKVAAPTILTYTDNAAKVFAELTYDELVKKLESLGYFRIDAYDYDDDGVYDELVYIPYTFGQYASRTYKDSSNGNKAAAFTMIGTYAAAPVYDTTNGAAKTAENRTNFIERFAGTTSMASSTSKYTPGDSTLTVSKAKGELAKDTKLSGVEIKSGDFMIYNYNKLTNKLYVAANLGTMQTGTLSGLNKKAQTVTIDGDALAIGILGNMDAATGILAGTDAYEAIEETRLQPILSSYKKGEINVRYLEYDGKIAYIESYSDTDNLVCGDYVIVDIEKTMKDHKKAVNNDDEVWDIGFENGNAVVKVYNPETAKIETVKVESLTVRTRSGDETQSFKNAEERNKLGIWTKNTLYDLFKANGALYLSEDSDGDGFLELYAAGTKKFDGEYVDKNGNKTAGILGAPVIQASGSNADVSFGFGKSNKFVGTNYIGIPTDRYVTGADTVAIVIAGDGYAAVTGELGKKTTEINSLWLSAAAEVLRSDSKALIIYDPASTLSETYKGNTASIWHTGETADKDDGIGYYLFGAASKYIESRLKLDESGNPVEDDNGKKLYEHEYKNLINLRTNRNESITLVSTDAEPITEDVINSVTAVIRVDAENNEVKLTSFGEVYVENGDYTYGGFSWLAAADRIQFVTMPKDGKPGAKVAYDQTTDVKYQTLDSLNVTFIDLDAGAGVDYKKYSFADSYIFHQDNESNRANYQVVDLKDTTCPDGTFAIRRNYVNGTDATDAIVDGAITTLNAGKSGLICSQHWFRWNGWSDYLIPAVDSNYETIWNYAGSLRVRVTYYAYLDYDPDANSLKAVVVRVGEIIGVVASGEDIPAARDPETEGPTNETITVPEI